MAMSFFIVRYFFSFAFVCRVSGWPSVSSIPQRLVPRQRTRTVSHAAGGDEAWRISAPTQRHRFLAGRSPNTPGLSVHPCICMRRTSGMLSR